MSDPILKLGSHSPDVVVLQRALDALGYSLVADGDFGPKTTFAARAFQEDRGLAVDGVVGPKTWAALRAAVPAEKPQEPEEPEQTDRLRAAGLAAVAEAERIWKMDIVDPPNSARAYAEDRAVIDEMIRTNAGLGWSWQKPYVKDGDYQWCLAFAFGKCWGTAGLKLKPHRYTFGSSTYRVDRWAHYQDYEGTPSGPRPTDSTRARMVVELNEHSTVADAVFPDGTEPREGDIALVGPVSTTMPYGTHGVLVRGFDKKRGVILTYEGNAGSTRAGLGPRGDNRQGVIKAERLIGGGGYCVRRLVRPGLADLVDE